MAQSADAWQHIPIYYAPVNSSSASRTAASGIARLKDSGVALRSLQETSNSAQLGSVSPGSESVQSAPTKPRRYHNCNRPELRSEAGWWTAIPGRSAIGRIFLSACISVLTLANAVSTEPVRAAQTLTPEQVRALVQKLDILRPEVRKSVYASCETALCTISLFRHPDATREDCKIDAVLLTRELKRADSNLKMVRCLFYDSDRQSTFWDINVRASLVTAFGEGRINRSTLLKSVTLSEADQANPLSHKYRQTSYKSLLEQDSVAPGPFEDNRLALALLLKSLTSRKIDTSQFHSDFLRIEDAARRGKTTGLRIQIDSLNNRIDARVQELISSGQLLAPLTKLSGKNLLEQQQSATTATK